MPSSTKASENQQFKYTSVFNESYNEMKLRSKINLPKMVPNFKLKKINVINLKSKILAKNDTF